MITVRLADGHDVQARHALAAALRAVGARRLWEWAGHGGSQEVRVLWHLVGWRVLRVEAETYAGLTVHGPAAAVNRIATAFARNRGTSG